MPDPTPPPTDTAPAMLATDTPTHQRVAEVIEGLRPVIQADGGDVELLGVTKKGVVRVRLLGACVGCPSAAMTLHQGIERSVRENVPEITGIHACDG